MIMSLREVTLMAVVFRLTVAVLVGGLLGMERGLKNRPAGMRTYMLVCLGSCLIMLTNQYIYQATQVGDPMRLGAQVVSGIGFLGAGTIVVTKYNQIKGLTTAAGLWASAGVGLALGIGFYEAALVTGILIFFVLTVMQRWDAQMHSKARFLELYIEHTEAFSLRNFMQFLRSMDISVESYQTETDATLSPNSRAFVIYIKTKKRMSHDGLLEDIRKFSGVTHLEEF